jgi:hypothetical protein
VPLYRLLVRVYCVEMEINRQVRRDPYTTACLSLAAFAHRLAPHLRRSSLPLTLSVGLARGSCVQSGHQVPTLAHLHSSSTQQPQQQQQRPIYKPADIDAGLAATLAPSLKRVAHAKHTFLASKSIGSAPLIARVLSSSSKHTTAQHSSARISTSEGNEPARSRQRRRDFCSLTATTYSHLTRRSTIPRSSCSLASASQSQVCPYHSTLFPSPPRPCPANPALAPLAAS